MELIPLCSQQLAEQLSATSDFVLIDVRPSGHYCNRHIKHAESLNLSNILLRRLLKGVVRLDSVINAPELLDRLTMCSRNCDPAALRLVLYDAGSTAGSIKPELARHAEALCMTGSSEDSLADASSGFIVHFLDGGFASFSSQFPSLCEQSSGNSPVRVSVSASLPISFQTRQTTCEQKMQLQTPQEEESNLFGPPVEILPHLVLGCAKDSANLPLLRELGVTAILNVSSHCPHLFTTLFEYQQVAVEDSYQADILSNLSTAFSFIDTVKQKGGKVFIHCHAGISRSATICIAYIMKQMACDLAYAYDFVKQKRPCISPNLNFMGQLLEFQKQLHSAEARNTDSVTSSDMHHRTTSNNTEASIPSIAYANTDHKSISAPSTLSLLPAPRYPSSLSSGSPAMTTCTIELQPTSFSLPSTPISLFKNQLPGGYKLQFPESHRARILQTLQLSPCRVAAGCIDRNLRCHRVSVTPDSL